MFRIFTLILTLLLSNTVFAGTTASSVRTDSGQIISVGDSLTEMSSRINQSPVSMNSYETKEGETTVTVSDYTYDIDNIRYTFTIINNQVKKIEWTRKDI
ncbi:hypothetical protein BEN71_14980 [Acinetobacter wuhouensis]|uniref:hypothetical protein n=1 Tax=Acinetobacter wuhouensis TaxID=1879050 RepID=UPI00083B531F|nr:hypothetical protein [Acinetobacter wuhouensis]AXQ23292.1 hypothetical protein BEN71_14980 [Acinetobacter wuhouensis]